MKTLEKLRAELKDAKAEHAKALEKVQAEGATPEDFTALKNCTAKMRTLVDQIKDIEDAIAAEAAAADEPARGGAIERGVGEGHRTFAEPKEKLKSSDVLGLAAIAVVKSKREGGQALKHIEDLGYARLAADIVMGQKSMNTGSAVAGGLVIPSNTANFVTDLLYPNSTWTQGNAVKIPMPNGNYNEPAGATGSTASWTGEGKPAQPSEPTFREIKMSYKTLTCMTPMTQDFMKFSMSGARGFIERSMGQAMGLAYDSGMYRGTGVQNMPLGAYRIDGIGTLTPSGGAAGKTPTAAEARAFARRMINLLALANVPFTNVYWTMDIATAGYLEDLKTAGGENPEFPTMAGTNKSWMGFPVLVNSNLPSNLGVGGDESELSLIAFGHVLEGEISGMEMAYSEDATIVVNGQVYSAFQNRLGILLGVIQTDVALRYLRAVALASGIKWGKP